MGKTYKHLSLEQPMMIQTQLSMAIKPAAMARELGRLPSIISRELKRNGWVRPPPLRSRGRPWVAGGYGAACS